MYSEKKGIVITVSNIKGGCGKSTLSCLIAQYLAIEKVLDESKNIKRKGVCILDMDKPQFTCKTYFLNRKKFFQDNLISPIFIDFDFENNNVENFYNYIEDLKDNFDYIIIDSGGHHDNVTKAAINVANILITPVLNTLVDFNVLFQYNYTSNQIVLGTFVNFVKESKNPNRKLFWYLVPNKCNPIVTEYSNKCLQILKSMSSLIGFKVTEPIMDRYIYSQSFDMGLNIFDDEITKYFITSPATINNGRKEIMSVLKYIFA
jgi:cellulose biosynthesis protein BcsQ